MQSPFLSAENKGGSQGGWVIKQIFCLVVPLPPFPLPSPMPLKSQNPPPTAAPNGRAAPAQQFANTTLHKLANNTQTCVGYRVALTCVQICTRFDPCVLPLHMKHQRCNTSMPPSPQTTNPSTTWCTERTCNACATIGPTPLCAHVSKSVRPCVKT